MIKDTAPAEVVGCTIDGGREAITEVLAGEYDSMSTRTRWAHVLVIVGLIAMLIGAVDPLEGSLIILPGSGIAALGAFLGQSRQRRLVYWAFGLIAVGVGAMFVLSTFGGSGGNTGRSNWWLLVVLPYPVGWIMGLVGVFLGLRKC